MDGERFPDIYEGDEMNIDFLSWKVEKAEGFEIKDHPTLKGVKFFVYPSGCFTFTYESFPIEQPTYKELIDPMLTQRAIEGVNLKRDKFSIVQDYIAITVCDENLQPLYDYHDYKFFKEEFNISIDQAKESALKYIWEQETQNER